MKLLTPKNVLTLIGAISLIEGIAFFFGAETVTKSAFITFTGQDAIRVGALMHEALAGMMASSGIIILSARGIEETAAKAVLKGVGFGYLVFFAVAMKHFFGGEAQPPIPALILLITLMSLAFYTGTKKNS